MELVEGRSYLIKYPDGTVKSLVLVTEDSDTVIMRSEHWPERWQFSKTLIIKEDPESFYYCFRQLPINWSFVGFAILIGVAYFCGSRRIKVPYNVDSEKLS
ncbi:MAG: hypothetical protein KGN01_05990 [Patescibacteria group bacterium]|nr:hypothetical protein [Patescibacteria group bacterium]